MNEITKLRIKEIEDIEALLEDAEKRILELSEAIVEELKYGKMRVQEITPILAEILRDQKNRLTPIIDRLKYVKSML